MTISSHLTPQPEPRLWQLLELVRRAVDRADLRIAALTGLAALEAALARPAGYLGFTALGALALALPLGVFALIPSARAPRWLRFLAGTSEKTGGDDCLTSEEDLASYTVGELILRLDRYLGGGVTGTPYYEDLVVQIVDLAVLARVKQRLLLGLWGVVGAAQVLLAASLLAFR